MRTLYKLIKNKQERKINMILSHFIFQTIFGFWSSYYFLDHALNSNLEFFAGLFCLFFSGMMFILGGIGIAGVIVWQAGRK